MEWRLWERVDILHHEVSAANQDHSRRTHLFVEVVMNGASGWGEVTPLEVSAWGDPSVVDVRETLQAETFTEVISVATREKSLPAWSRIHLHSHRAPASRWAFAAIEMALLDLELVRQQRRVDQLWPPAAPDVPTMATTSLLSFDPQWTPDAEAQRIRVKTSPAIDVAPYLSVISSWQRPILLDFNGSATNLDVVRHQLTQLRNAVDVAAVEQPFPPGNLTSHAEVAQLLDVTVSLDEGVRTVLDLRQIARYGAATLVCVKPPRVGGIAAARSLLAEASRLGLRAYVGGFFESNLARTAHRAMAAAYDLEPSDVGPVDFGPRACGDLQRDVGIGTYPSPEALRLVHSQSWN